MSHRADVNSLSPNDRRALVAFMLQYLTDRVVADHMNIIHAGIDFFTGHRAYLAAMEAFLSASGENQFVPLSKWDPATPIPAEFNVVKARDNGTPRPPLRNLTPNLPMPAEFTYPAVCDYETPEDLADAVNPWHGEVHVTIGGSMGSLTTAPAAPIFWCWHAFVDDIYYDWQNCQIDVPAATGVSVGLAELRIRNAGLTVGGITRLPRSVIRPEAFDTPLDPQPVRTVRDFGGERLEPPRRVEDLLRGPRVIAQSPAANSSVRHGSSVHLTVLLDA